MSVTVEEIEKIVATQLGARKVSRADRLVEDLGAESADVVNIVAAVEDKYAIAIEEEALPDIFTVGDLFELVRGRV